MSRHQGRASGNRSASTPLRALTELSLVHTVLKMLKLKSFSEPSFVASLVNLEDGTAGESWLAQPPWSGTPTPGGNPLTKPPVKSSHASFNAPLSTPTAPCLAPSLCGPRCEGQRPFLPPPAHSALLGFQKCLLLNTQEDTQGQNDHIHFSNGETDTGKPRQDLTLEFHGRSTRFIQRPGQCAAPPTAVA